MHNNVERLVLSGSVYSIDTMVHKSYSDAMKLAAIIRTKMNERKPIIAAFQ